MTEQRQKYSKRRERYKAGLKKLQFSKDSIDQMNKGLKRLLPKITKITEENEILIAAIAERMPSVEEARKVVKDETAIAEEEQKRVKTIQQECELDLAEALPMLEDAQNALNTLKKNDIDEVKSFRTPPGGVLLVMEAVCLMLEATPDRIPDPNDPSRKINEWWSASKRLLGDSSLLQRLSDFDRDRMDKKIMSVIREQYVSDKNFNEESLTKISVAATGLCLWVRAMACYDSAIRVVRPKRESLDQANEKLLVAQEELEVKRDQLKVIEKDLSTLTSKMGRAVKKLNGLKSEEELCRLKLLRAEELLESLGPEKDRWRSEVDYCTECEMKLPGDVLMAVCLISHTGNVDEKTRSILCEKFVAKIIKEKLPHTQATMDCSSSLLLHVLGSTVEARQWKNDGLSSDAFTVENAIMVHQSGDRFPLLIDPQGRATEWIKATQRNHAKRKRKNDSSKIKADVVSTAEEKSNGHATTATTATTTATNQFIILRSTDDSLLRDLVVAAECGFHVLLEHCDYDHLLSPLDMFLTRSKIILKEGEVGEASGTARGTTHILNLPATISTMGADPNFFMYMTRIIADITQTAPENIFALGSVTELLNNIVVPKFD